MWKLVKKWNIFHVSYSFIITQILVDLVGNVLISFLVDISTNYENVEKVLNEAERDLGPVYMLVNCAGTAICGKFEDMSINDIHVSIVLIFFFIWVYSYMNQILISAFNQSQLYRNCLYYKSLNNKNEES